MNPRSQVTSIGAERELLHALFAGADYVHQHWTNLDRTVDLPRARLQNSGKPERPLVVGRELSPARHGFEAERGQRHAMGHSRRTFGVCGVVGRERSIEIVLRGIFETLILESDFPEQRVRVDDDALLLGGGRGNCGAARRYGNQQDG